MTRIVLVDPQTMFREAIRQALEQEPAIEVVADSSSIDELNLGLEPNIDVIFIDPVPQDGPRSDLNLSVCNSYPSASIVLLTGARSERLLTSAFEAGVSGIILKSEPISTVLSAVRHLEAGEDLLSTTDALDMLRALNATRREIQQTEAKIARLTRREVDLLRCLAEGLHDRDIAERLCISSTTVRTHMVNIYEKIGVKSRLEALIFAIRGGLVQIDDTPSRALDWHVTEPDQSIPEIADS